MPVRLVCPSCSATLSVKDEYAGRAVKCPKCAGIIPASQPGTAVPAPPQPPAQVLPPPPAPEPEPAPPAPSPFEALDEPVAPKPKITGRPMGKPVAKAPVDDEERGAKTGARDRDEGDRPARSKRPRNDDDGAGDGQKKGGSKAPLILAVVFGGLLLCCGGGGFAAYYFVIKPVKEGVQKGIDEIRALNFQVNVFNYTDLEVGTATRNDTAAKLGTGKLATADDLTKAFASEPARAEAWKPKAAQQRVMIWQSGEDYIVAAFHPDGEGTARLQAKEWRPKSGATLRDGELDDAKFLQRYPLGGGPGIEVTAEELAKAYKDNAAAADTKYKNKNVLVEGKLNDINYAFDGEIQALLEGVPPAQGKILGTQIRVAMTKADANKILGVSRGQTVKLKGKCTGALGDLFIDVANATFDSAGTDPAPSLTAANLLAEYVKNAETTDEKYKDKPITITNAVVESKDGDSSLFVVGSTKKGGAAKIKVALPFDARKQIATLKASDRIKIKGEYSSSSDNVIYINRAYIVP